MYMAKKTPYTNEELIKIREIAASRNAKIEILYPDMEKIVGSTTDSAVGGGKGPAEENLPAGGDGHLQGHETDPWSDGDLMASEPGGTFL